MEEMGDRNLFRIQKKETGKQEKKDGSRGEEGAGSRIGKML